MLEQALSTAETTCGTKAPGDKESKGLLSGDQATTEAVAQMGRGTHCRMLGTATVSHMGQQQGCRGLLAIPTGGFWTSGTRACGCSQSGTAEVGRAGRVMKGHGPLPAVPGLQEGQAGMGWDGLARPGHCWSLQGQQPVGSQWQHRVGLRAQALCRWAGQGLSLGLKSSGAMKCPSSPALPEPEAPRASPGLAPASALEERMAKGRCVFNNQCEY